MSVPRRVAIKSDLMKAQHFHQQLDVFWQETGEEKTPGLREDSHKTSLSVIQHCVCCHQADQINNRRMTKRNQEKSCYVLKNKPEKTEVDALKD